MSKNLKLSIALVAAAVIVLVAVVAFGGGDEPKAPESAAERDSLLVRPSSQRLTDGPDATFVEFLDFECEACGALYPVIEQLEEEYGDRITFVVRYMPLHTSSMNAARAAEAAAAQGKFAEMYDVLFQRQTEWGHQDTPEEARFFTYAEELGLDMEQFRTVYEDPATIERIELNQADGQALGVTGTPTMFLDGKMLEVNNADELVAALDAALER